MLGIFTALPAPIQSVSAALIGLGAASIALALLAPKIAGGENRTRRAPHRRGECRWGNGRVRPGDLRSGRSGNRSRGLGALGRQITNLTKGSAAPVSDLASALADLGEKGTVTGELANQFGSDLSGLGNELEQFKTPGIIQALALLNPNLQDAKRDVKAVDEALAELVVERPTRTGRGGLEKLTASIVAEGGDPSRFTDRLDKYHGASGL